MILLMLLKCDSEKWLGFYRIVIIHNKVLAHAVGYILNMCVFAGQWYSMCSTQDGDSYHGEQPGQGEFQTITER